MNPQGGQYLNKAAVLSPLGAVHLAQLVLGCAVISLVIHGAGYSGTYGTFCVVSWGSCFGLTAAIFILDVTRLHSCLPVSWENLTVTLAASATLLYLTSSVLYPVFFLSSECPYNDCEVRNFRIAVTSCSWAAFLAYAAEVFLSRAKRLARAPAYMSTPSGLLKVAQAFMGCAIFVALANGTEFTRHAGTVFCVVAFAICFATTILVVVLSVCRHPALPRVPLDRSATLFAFGAVLLYLSAAVAWPVFCFDKKYGTPLRPQGCPRGKCVWDSQLIVCVLCFVNLGLYTADLWCSQRARFGAQQLRV